ncbi:MAG: hypothetical protein ACTHJM_07515 [Marmoricola sp.]
MAVLPGRKRKSRLQTAIEEVADAARGIAEQATDAAPRVASEVAKRSTDLGSQVGEKMSDVVGTVAQEGQALMERHDKKSRDKAVSRQRPRRHRLRKLVLLTGGGALAAYFLDPQNGGERRADARRRISRSADVMGDGLDRGAHAAHQAAVATGPAATNPLA